MNLQNIEDYISNNLINNGFEKTEALFNSIVVSSFYEKMAEENDIAIERLESIIPLPVFNETQDDVTQNPNFLKWSETDEIIESFDAKYTDFDMNKAYILRAYHGTSHKIESFEAIKYGNKEGHFGAVNYFTTDYFDAKDNYSGVGPDMGVKIDKLTDDILNSEEFCEKYGHDVEDFREEAEKMAKERLLGNNQQVVEVFIKTKKPFIIGEYQRKFIEFVNFEEIEQQSIEQLLDNNGISREEYDENQDDYQDELDEIRWEIHDETENPLIQAINEVACYWDLDPSSVLSDIYEFSHEGTFTTDLEQTLRKNETIQCHEDINTNEYMAGHLISEIIRKLGYDSIILLNPEQRFKGMDIDPNSVHIHVFDEFKSNIKSVHNFGKFNTEDPRILYQPELIDDNLNFNQERGFIKINPNGKNWINLNHKSDATTFIHEIGHHFLFAIRTLASYNSDKSRDSINKMDIIKNWWQENAFDIAEESRLYSEKEIIKLDVETYLKNKSLLTPEKSKAIEKACDEYFARGLELYLRNQSVNSSRIQTVFNVIKSWFSKIYKKSEILKVTLNKDISLLFDSIFVEKNEKAKISNNKDVVNSILNCINEDLDTRTRKKSLDIINKLANQVLIDEDTNIKINKSPGGNIIIGFYKNNKLNDFEGNPAITVVNPSGEIMSSNHFKNGKKCLDFENHNEVTNKI